MTQRTDRSSPHSGHPNPETGRPNQDTGHPSAGTRPATALLSFGHACVDLYQGAVPALVPFLVAERHYSYLAVSGIVLAATLLSSVVQPLFGVLTDRLRIPWLIPVAMTTTGLGVALVGVGDSYVLAWIAIAFSGLGVAAYHPEAAKLARSVTRGRQSGMSWFSLGGNLGFAAAPVFVTPILSAGGVGASPYLVIPAAVGALLTCVVLRSLTRKAAEGVARKRAAGSDDWPAFLRMTLVVICRSIVFVGLGGFVAVFVQQQAGVGTFGGNAALLGLYAGSAVGTVLGGRLATRWGRVRTVGIAYTAAIPAVLGTIVVPGPLVYFFVVVVGLTLYVPFSLHITLGQDYLPNRIGTASGVTLGLAVSVGGVCTPVLGALADATSLRWALSLLLLPLLVAWWFGRRLREPAPLEG